MPRKPIFVAATKQHVGKTTLSLALMSGLIKKRFNQVGFIKPVGQEHVRVTDPASGQQLLVDKALIRTARYSRSTFRSTTSTTPA